MGRVAFDVPVFDFQVGDGKGQVPLRQLQKKIMKLPRDLKGPQVADLNFRLKANSKAVDAGLAIPTVNDGFAGKAPDLGALELGKPEPKYGPRWLKGQPFYR